MLKHGARSTQIEFLRKLKTRQITKYRKCANKVKPKTLKMNPRSNLLSSVANLYHTEYALSYFFPNFAGPQHPWASYENSGQDLRVKFLSSTQFPGDIEDAVEGIPL